MLEIVMVHDVLAVGDPEPGPYACAITVDELDSYLGHRHDWVNWSGDDLATWLKCGQPPVERPTYLVTFDDAYESVRTRALPVLESYSVKALVFVATRCADGWEPMESRVWRLVQSASSLSSSCWPGVLVDTAENKRQAYETIRQSLKPLSRSKWEPMLDSIPAAPNQLHGGQYLDWKDLAELRRHPCLEFGSHTMEHAHLPTAGFLEVRRQLVGSRRELETRLGTSVRWLAYPYGGVSVASILCASAAGYTGAFLARSATRRVPAMMGRFMLPRTDIQSLTRRALT